MVISNNLKRRFINRYAEVNHNNIKNIICSPIVQSMEKAMNKDLYEFNPEEILTVIGDVSGTGLYSKQTGLNRRSVISKYIDFALKEGYLTTGINFARLITPEEIEKLVSDKVIKNKFISKEELIYIVDMLDNAVDAAFLMLLFEGIKGKQLAEVRHLKIQDIDFENKILKLYDNDGSTRNRKVSQKLVDILFEAYLQREYKNISKKGIEKTYQLPQSDYIIRNCTKETDKPASYGTLTNRFNIIKNRAIGNPYLTITSIWESGMIYYTKTIIKERNLEKLTIEHYKEISQWAGRSEKSYFSTKRVVELFI